MTNTLLATALKMFILFILGIVLSVAKELLAVIFISCRSSYTHYDTIDYTEKQRARQHHNKVNIAKRSYENACHQVDIAEANNNIHGNLASAKRTADARYADFLAAMSERD